MTCNTVTISVEEQQALATIHEELSRFWFVLEEFDIIEKRIRGYLEDGDKILPGHLGRMRRAFGDARDTAEMVLSNLRTAGVITSQPGDVQPEIGTFPCQIEDVENECAERIGHLDDVMGDFVWYTKGLQGIGRDAPRGIKHKIPVWYEDDHLNARRIEERLLGIIALYPIAIDRVNRLINFVEAA